MSNTVASSSSSTAGRSRGGHDRTLQDRLNLLLSRLHSATGILRDWPESTDADTSKVHHDATTDLLGAIRRIVDALRSVEDKVNGTGECEGDGDEELRKRLASLEVPVDLLELLDRGGGLNPDCYSRGLLREALRRLAELKRRKRALVMLKVAIETGLAARDAAANTSDVAKPKKEEGGNAEELRTKVKTVGEEEKRGTKRQRSEETDDILHGRSAGDSVVDSAPPAKKQDR